jgi:hypothetical protein
VTLLPDVTYCPGGRGFVPALTLRQPWAQAIARGSKRVENRTWMPPEHVTRIFIHAGKVTEAADIPQVRALGVPVDIMAQSAIVAVADLAHACKASRLAATQRWADQDRLQCGCDPVWAQPGQCHWVLGTVWTLARPVPCGGRQGLWYPAGDALDAIRRQLHEARVNLP